MRESTAADCRKQVTFDILLRVLPLTFVSSGHQLKHRKPKLSRQYESSMITTLDLLLRNPQNGRKHKALTLFVLPYATN